MDSNPPRGDTGEAVYFGVGKPGKTSPSQTKSVLVIPKTNVAVFRRVGVIVLVGDGVRVGVSVGVGVSVNVDVGVGVGLKSKSRAEQACSISVNRINRDTLRIR